MNEVVQTYSRQVDTFRWITLYIIFVFLRNNEKQDLKLIHIFQLQMQSKNIIFLPYNLFRFSWLIRFRMQVLANNHIMNKMKTGDLKVFIAIISELKIPPIMASFLITSGQYFVQHTNDIENKLRKRSLYRVSLILRSKKSRFSFIIFFNTARLQRNRLLKTQKISSRGMIIGIQLFINKSFSNTTFETFLQFASLASYDYHIP